MTDLERKLRVLREHTEAAMELAREAVEDAAADDLARAEWIAEYQARRRALDTATDD